MLKLNKIHCINALDGLKKLPDESIDMVITSPPYYNLRNYGKITESIWDETVKCRHVFGDPITLKRTGGGQNSKVFNNRINIDSFTSKSCFCIKCGAWKGQLGLETDFHLYIKHLLDIFSEVKRVLKPDGTCWINIGDSYGNSNMKTDCRNWSKCLLGLPERLALGMIQRGWYFRNRIVWHKPNNIPSPVKDRLTHTWEYLYLFSKSQHYYFDLDSIRVPPKREIYHKKGKNPGDLWSIATKPFKEAHFAVSPEEIIKRPVLTTRPNSIILDPFIGSGTTAVVAKKLGRRFIGFEANPEYVKIARRRIKNS